MIKFDFSYSSISVHFLYATVKKIFHTRTFTTVFKKEKDCQAYLRVKSKHLESLKHSIPYNQALHLKQICTKDCDFKASCDILSKKRIDRGYKKAQIYDSISKTFDRNREHWNILQMSDIFITCSQDYQLCTSIETKI